MSPISACAQLFIEALQRNTKYLLNLNQLLEQERQLIEISNHSGLIELLEQKETLLDAIQEAEQNLLQLLNKCGYKTPLKKAIASTDTFSQLAVQLPEALQVSFTQAWTALKTTLAETNQLNVINRRLVEYSKYSVDHLLGILRGSQPNPVLYQANGRYDGPSEYHSLAKA